MGDDEWFDDYDEQDFSADDNASLDDASSQEDDNNVSVSPNSQQPPYQILDKPQLEKIQNDAITGLISILGFTTTTARALLIFFNWDVEQALSTIAERGDVVYKRAGITSNSDIPPTPLDGEAVSCGVCMCDVERSGVSACSCGHAFCNDCWQQQLNIAVSEGQGRSLKCMSPGCGVVCDEETVRKLLGDEAVLVDKYNKSLLESYVEDNKKVKWCPSVPHCGHAIRVNSDTTQCEVTCPCSQQFCFNCLETPHSPATCVMLREWTKKIKDGSETLTWLSANTKACPKCDKAVEKNGGCNLVLCRCGQAFCWLCGQATGRAHTWENIQGHSCGAYKDQAESKASTAERNLKRYMHYLTRYEAHLQSLRFEEQARKDIDEKVEELIEAEASVGNYTWLIESMEQLFLARRTLSYSYIFAYYMFDGEMFRNEITPTQNGINKALFEDKQGQLEAEVEKLAEAVESSARVIATKRMSIINLSSSINLRIVKMYEVIENDIAAQLAGCSLDIAPYKGQRTQLPVPVQLTSLTGLAAAGGNNNKAKTTSGAGGGGSKEVEIIDLTKDEEEEEGGGGAGSPPAAQRAKRRR